MRRVTTKRELRAALVSSRGERRVLVPTMGALHAGHAELLRRARDLAGKDGCVVASVFLNPVQFDNEADLSTYPRHQEDDAQLCEDCGVDVLFMPTPQEMYYADRSMVVEEKLLSRALCGAKRPGHFAGVCLVVSKLFNMVQPTDAVFGKKDFQQLAILRRMVRDLDYPITLHGVPTVREPSGLAISSRNERLTGEQRVHAPKLYAALKQGAAAYVAGESAANTVEIVTKLIETIPGTRIDYVEMVQSETFEPLEIDAHEEGPLLLAAAVWFGEVRLIDHVEILR